jgi:hypothetical protein
MPNALIWKDRYATQKSVIDALFLTAYNERNSNYSLVVTVIHLWRFIEIKIRLRCVRTAEEF